MSISDIDQKTMAMGVMASLMAYMFYGRIQDASDIQAIKQELIQLKTEQVDLWGKYNDDIKEKSQMMMTMANYMIEQEITHGEMEGKINEVELNSTERWLEYYKR